jgi:hypothetical protein
MKQEAAETLALRLLGFVAADDSLATGFVGASGLAPSELARGAGDPAVLAGLVDFILQDDATVLAAAAHLGLPPQTIPAIRRALPGGLATDWS